MMHYVRVGFAIGLIGLSVVGAVSLAENGSGEEEFAPVATFAGGTQYFMQKSSVKPLGNGILQYNVVGVPSQRSGFTPTHPVSVNEVDCKTGQYKSALQTSNLDDKGNVISTSTGSPYGVTLNKQSQLYSLLKDACQENAPDMPIQW